MNNKSFYFVLAAFLGFLFIAATNYSPSTDGSPAGVCGAPNDDKDCSSCHKGKPKAMDGLITSNIDNNAYEPGKKYTITLNVKGNAKSKKFGFQTSPQNAKGKVMGKLIVTNPTETKTAGNGKYMNQIKGGVDGNVSKTWTFDWVAPAKGSGDITFYGSFLIGGKPETMYNSTLALKEAK